MALSKLQAKFLRGLGQRLRPKLHVGREGLTPSLEKALDELLAHHELVKVRVLPNAALPAREVAAALAGGAGAELVGVVGNTLVLYRPNPQLKERIELPD